MVNYKKISDLSKEFDFNDVVESVDSNKFINKDLISNLAKNQLIFDLFDQRDNFMEMMDNQIEKISSSLVNFISIPWDIKTP